jgi:porin
MNDLRAVAKAAKSISVVLLLLAVTATNAQNSESIADADETLIRTQGDGIPSDGSFRNSSYKVGYKDRPEFGGPNTPAGQMEETDRVKEPAFRFPRIYDATKPWRDWKKELNEDHGLQFSGHYTTLYQGITDTAPGQTDDKAASGVLRGTVIWKLLGDNSEPDSDFGAVNLMLDHRHAFRDVAPADLAAQAGYTGVTGALYGDTDLVVVNLNWTQSFADRQAGILVGRYDPSDYMNILGYVNPWTTFSNVSILLDSSVAYSDAGWGAAGGFWMKDRVYILGGFNDANGKLTDDLEFFDGGSEFYKFAEIGWSPIKGDRYFKNIHLTYWHVDERNGLDPLNVIDSGQGVAFAANWTFADKWMPFVRAGISDGAEQVKIYDKSASVGFIWRYAKADLLGFGINWGETPAAQEQTTLETFWRFQFSQSFAITPSLQYLMNPASNPDDVWLFGIRMRLTF